MLRKLTELFRWCARISRQGTALAILFLSVRFAWLAGSDLLSEAGKTLPAGLSSGNEGKIRRAPDKDSIDDAMEAVQAEDTAHRPDLDKLKDFEGSKLAEDTREAPAPENTRLRRLLVDLGPNRSEVFVGGRLVGHTPYVGQVSCEPNESIKIQVLPPKGVPLFRVAVCRGDTILANE